VVEVRAVRGRVMVAGVPLGPSPAGRSWGLPPELVDALAEWARIAETVPAGTGRRDPDGIMVSRRGRHLAAWVSVALRVPVDYCDPVSGQRVALRAVTRVLRVPPVPSMPPTAQEVPHDPSPIATPPEGLAASTTSATPWATGLAVVVLVAGLVLLANLALAGPMVAGLGAVGVLIDAVVVAGLVPALWLNRRAPTWRWAVYGTLAGMGLCLPALLVQAFGG
jgi:hypothetical protein